MKENHDDKKEKMKVEFLKSYESSIDFFKVKDLKIYIANIFEYVGIDEWEGNLSLAIPPNILIVASS